MSKPASPNEIQKNDGDQWELWCPGCDKVFDVEMSINVDFSTFKKEE